MLGCEVLDVELITGSEPRMGVQFYAKAKDALETKVPGFRWPEITYYQAVDILKEVVKTSNFKRSQWKNLLPIQSLDEVAAQSARSHLTQCTRAFEIADEARSWADQEVKALAEARAGDLNDQKVIALTGIFKVKGLCKMFTRKAMALHSTFNPVFMGDRNNYLRYLPAKNDKPLLSIVDCTWSPPRPNITPESVVLFNSLL